VPCSCCCSQEHANPSVSFPPSLRPRPPGAVSRWRSTAILAVSPTGILPVVLLLLFLLLAFLLLRHRVALLESGTRRHPLPAGRGSLGAALQ
jgi:hypothetical protein